ncbi:MAG TPA: hypothetical protein ENK85_00110 [Saprospiraceae bacterium]|nr:hypothetical protein [Saprospiraceae bacterium]
MTTGLLKFLPKNNCFIRARLIGRKLIFLFWVLVLAHGSLSAQKSFVKNISLVRLFETLEKTYQVSFSYDVQLVEGKKIKYFEFSNKNLEKDLVALLRDSQLGFEKLDNNIIIKRVTPEFYKKFYTKTCGQVIDMETGLPLGHVAVSVQNTGIGVNADSLGYFSLEGPFVPADDLTVSFIGYAPKILSLSFFINQPCKVIFLRPKKLEITEVIVREDFNQLAGIKLSQMEPDVIIIKPDRMTGTGGLNPKDVFGTLQQIPGVSASDETATTLNVRGGSSGQNLVMFDNIPLYHYGHLFGKVSSFNEAVVGNVRFNKGSFSSQNGGRVASIIDIQGKKDIPNQIKIKSELGLLNLGLSAEVPFAKQKAAFFVAYRKSIFDNSALNRILFDQIFQGTRVEDNQEKANQDSLHQILLVAPHNSFYDFFAKAIWKPTDEDRVEVTGLKMGDRLNYGFASCPNVDCYMENDSLSLENIGYNASWEHHWRPNFFSSIKYSYSGFNKEYHFANNVTEDSTRIFERKQNDIDDHSFQLNSQWQRNDIRMNFGFHRRKIHTLNDNQQKYFMVEDTFFDNSIGRTNSLFLDYRHDLSDKFHIFIGNRLSTYDLLERQLFFEPRFTVTSNPSPILKIKLSGAVYYQTMNQLLEPENLLGNDEMWVLSKKSDGTDSHLFSLQKSSQFSIGASLRKGLWQGSFDMYDKLVDGISSQVIDFDVIKPNSIGALHAQGIELGVQRWGKNYFTIVSFSQGKAVYEFPHSAEKIAAPYHQKRRLNLVQGIKYKDFALTMNWKLKSGLPFSAVDNILTDTLDANHFDYHLQYGPYNGGRLPKYSRLDVSLMYEHPFKWGKGTFNISILNILNHNNILKRYYNLLVSDAARLGDETPSLVVKERKGLPFTPNLSVSFQFGLGKPAVIPK